MGFELKDFRKKYEGFAGKYSLPGFSELNGDFEIDKIDKESEYFLRVIRKVMMEKVVNSLNFLDMLMNPVNAPRIYHGYIKGMSVEDRKVIDELYVSLGELSVISLGMEISYDEKEEAKLIKDIFKSWGEEGERVFWLDYLRDFF
jgi:hypothetical protein